MSDDVFILIPKNLVSEVMLTLKECYEDIQANLDAEYPQDLRDKYPSYERKYRRDREVVESAMSAWSSLGEFVG